MEDNADESPLYLFDRSFVEKMGLRATRGLKADYWAPDCFGEDLFSVLGEQRPDSRWLIIGPERSGSSFHKDPNATRQVLSFLFHSNQSTLADAKIVHGMRSSQGPSTGSCSRLHPTTLLHQGYTSQQTRAK